MVETEDEQSSAAWMPPLHFFLDPDVSQWSLPSERLDSIFFLRCFCSDFPCVVCSQACFQLSTADSFHAFPVSQVLAFLAGWGNCHPKQHPPTTQPATHIMKG